jgi:hypothetical protein
MSEHTNIYIVYQVTNLVNNKIYVGVHRHKPFDGYLGSGVSIEQAVKKYGKENFSRDILFVYDNFYDAYEKEGEIVNEEFIKRKDNYNMVPGGQIHYDYSESSREKMSNAKKGKMTAKDKDGVFYQVSVGDERLKTGELVHMSAGLTSMIDKDGKKYYVSVEDPRIKSGELFHKNKGRKNQGVAGTVSVRDKEGNSYRVEKDDPRYLSGELVHFRKGAKFSKESLEQMSKTKTGKKQTPEHIEKRTKGQIGSKRSEETKKIQSEKSKIVAANRPILTCPYCGLVGRGPRMKSNHFDNCKQALSLVVVLSNKNAPIRI